MTTQAISNPEQTRDKAGMYLTFMLGSEHYGLEIKKVREIVALIDVTPVPRSQAFIRGVINLRGHVIPVIDLRLKLGLPPVESNSRTCIIVVNLRNSNIGMIVDQVCDVMDLSEAEIDDAPSFGMQINADILLGIGKAGGRVTILLDVDMALSSDEVDTLKTTNS